MIGNQAGKLNADVHLLQMEIEIIQNVLNKKWK